MTQVKTSIHCTHCGDACIEVVHEHEHDFCCQGCANVYGMLTQNGLGNYYELNLNPGKKEDLAYEEPLDFLNNPKVVSSLVDYQEGGQIKVNLLLPHIHCSSCVFLLENLHQINSQVQSVRVDFLKRKASILFTETEEFGLRELFRLLTKIGYPPKVSLQDLDQKSKNSAVDKRLWYQLGLAGFVFGNVMLLSFPEYLGFDGAHKTFYLGYINLILATPLLIYGSYDYLRSAYIAIREKSLNIDVPLAIGILTLFFRSAYEVLWNKGEGYFDSFAGLMFFLLIGKFVQRITYKSIDFDRNYKSYFPIGILRLENNIRSAVPLDEIMPGDELYIRNEELIPVDGTILQGDALLDYAFVSGESDLIEKKRGEKVFAGAKLMGQPFTLLAESKVDQSRLTRLWQENAMNPGQRSQRHGRLLDQVGKWFTWGILLIAAITSSVWLMVDPSKALAAVTAVLIVACPCAISMAPPFTYSNLLRLLGNKKFYLKDAQTIELFQKINHLVFDKTGTLTTGTQFDVSYHGKMLDEFQQEAIRSLVAMSSHPLSLAIHEYLPVGLGDNLKADKFVNTHGMGLQAQFGDTYLKMGSSTFIFGTEEMGAANAESKVFVEINQQFVGHFEISQHYRTGLAAMFDELTLRGYQIDVLTGDSDRDDERLKKIVGPGVEIHYRQQPADKLRFIENLQEAGKKVMMIGDGLNDAGALKQSDIGIVVSDHTNNFIPACDGMLDGAKVKQLPVYLSMLSKARLVISLALIFATCYNLIGLGFAVAGNLSPVVAAILMPLSSLSIIAFSMLSSTALYAYYTRKPDL